VLKEDRKLTPEALEREAAQEEEEIVSLPNSWTITRGWLRTLTAFVALGFVTIETLLLFRFGFLLASANPANGFVDFIYDVSGGLVEPFDNIIGAEPVGAGVFEPAALIAAVVYAAAAMLIAMALWAAGSAPSASGRRAVRTRATHRMREMRGG
jgi:hypothetical protein